MFIRIICLLAMFGLCQVNCYVPVPKIYQKVDLALKHYSSQINHNPIVFSLLNVLIYDKRAKAFITNEAIEKSLEDVKKFNKYDEKILREIIYQYKSPLILNKPSNQLKQDIELALDAFFSKPDLNDDETFNSLSKKKKLL